MMRTRRGFSLVEAMLALVLASGALIAALNVVTASARAEAYARERATGDTLVAEVMADVLATAFEQPGWVGSFGRNAAEAGVTSRSGFNDVDDFDTWTEAPPKDFDGASRADLDDWSVAVTVVRVSLVDPEGSAVTYDSRVKRVTVQAKRGDRVIASQSAYRTAAWDDARSGIRTAAAPVGVDASGGLVEILDSSGNLLGGVTGVVGGTLEVLGGLLGGG